MTKPKDEPRSISYRQDVDFFYQAFQRLGQDQIAWRQFLKDLLTDSELRMIKRRFHIARLLAEGKSVREVARLAQVGTDTVNRVAKVFRSGSGALRKAVQPVKGSRSPQQKKDKPIRHWVFGDVND